MYVTSGLLFHKARQITFVLVCDEKLLTPPNCPTHKLKSNNGLEEGITHLNKPLSVTTNTEQSTYPCTYTFMKELKNINPTLNEP